MRCIYREAGTPLAGEQENNYAICSTCLLMRILIVMLCIEDLLRVWEG